MVIPAGGDLVSHNINVTNELKVKCDDATDLLLKTPDYGTSGQVVSSNGDGTMKFETLPSLTAFVTNPSNSNFDMGGYAITNVGLVDNVDISVLETTVGTNTTDITNLDTDKLNRSGDQAMTGSLDMGTFAITNVGLVDGTDISVLATAVGTNTTDITNLDTDKLNRSGDQAMTGGLNMGGFAITNVGLVDSVNVSDLETTVGINTTDILNLESKTQNIDLATTDANETRMTKDLRLEDIGPTIKAFNAINPSFSNNPNSGNFGFRCTPTVDITMTVLKYSTILYATSRSMTVWRDSDGANLLSYTFTGAEPVIDGYLTQPVSIPLSSGQIYVISVNNTGGSIRVDVNTNFFNAILSDVVGRTIIGSSALAMPTFDQGANLPYVPNFDFVETSLFSEKNIYANSAVFSGNVDANTVNNISIPDLSENVDELNILTEHIAPAGVDREWKEVLQVDEASASIYAENLDIMLFFNSGNGIYYSTDGGLTQTLCTSTGFGGRVIVAYDGVGVFVGVEVSTGGAWTSTDGITFTALASPGFNVSQITHYNSLFIVATNDAVNKIATSADNGISWTLRPMSHTPYNFATDGNILVACGGAGFSHSINGVDWFDNVVSEHCRGIAYDDDKDKYVSLSIATAGRVYTSPDGIVWTAHDDGYGKSANYLLYVSKYKMFYIGAPNAVTGGYGLEFSHDLLTTGFRTRALHHPHIQGGGIYHIGYLDFYDRFYINSNEKHYNYSLPCDCMAVTDDFITNDLHVLTVNGIQPNGGMYSGTSDGALIAGAGVQSMLPLSGIGTLTLISRELLLGHTFKLHASGDFPIMHKDTILNINFNINGVSHSLISIDLETSTNRFWELETDLVVRSEGVGGTYIANSDFIFNKALLKDLKGVRSIQTGSINTLIDNTISLDAEITINLTTTMKTRIMYLREEY
jgi:hypothetical protein